MPYHIKQVHIIIAAVLPYYTMVYKVSQINTSKLDQEVQDAPLEMVTTKNKNAREPHPLAIFYLVSLSFVDLHTQYTLLSSSSAQRRNTSRHSSRSICTSPRTPPPAAARSRS